MASRTSVDDDLGHVERQLPVDQQQHGAVTNRRLGEVVPVGTFADDTGERTPRSDVARVVGEIVHHHGPVARDADQEAFRDRCGHDRAGVGRRSITGLRTAS